jgi:hypothetical protein
MRTPPVEGSPSSECTCPLASQPVDSLRPPGWPSVGSIGVDRLRHAPSTKHRRNRHDTIHRIGCFPRESGNPFLNARVGFGKRTSMTHVDALRTVLSLDGSQCVSSKVVSCLPRRTILYVAAVEAASDWMPARFWEISGAPTFQAWSRRVPRKAPQLVCLATSAILGLMGDARIRLHPHHPATEGNVDSLGR